LWLTLVLYILPNLCCLWCWPPIDGDSLWNVRSFILYLCGSSIEKLVSIPVRTLDFYNVNLFITYFGSVLLGHCAKMKFAMPTASALTASKSCYQTLGPVCFVFLFIKVGRITVLIPPSAGKSGILPEVVCFFDVTICNLIRLQSWNDSYITFSHFYIKATKMSQIYM